MKFRLLLLFAFAIFTSVVSAQNSPVKWSFDAEKVNEQEYTIVFTATMDEGWYVYSQFLGDDGPIPTSFTFEGDGVQLIGKAEEKGSDRKEGFDEIFEMQLIKFGKEVKFTQKVKVAGANTSAKGFLTYMTCNNESCLPPTDVEFDIKLN